MLPSTRFAPWLISVAVLLGNPALPAAESPLSVVSVIRDPQALARPHDVEVDGDLMFVPGKGGSVALVDVSDPAQPDIVWWTRDPQDDAQTVLCYGRHLLVGSRDFLSIDVSAPGKARICRRLRDRPRIDRINGMVLWEDHALYANKTGWIGAVDVSRPDAPVLAGALNTREHGEVASPHDIARYEHCVIVVDQRDRSPWKVRAYRVADAETGELLSPKQWKAAGAVRGDRLNGANRVVMHGGCALVACNKAGTLAVVDFADPEKPEVVDVLPLSEAPCGLALSGNALFAGAGQAIHIFDVTDPQSPDRLAVYESGEVFPTRHAVDGRGEKKYTVRDGVRQLAAGNAHDLVYRDGYLYVTAQSDDQVAILHLDDPKIRCLADQPPAKFGGSCVPVKADGPITMEKNRRVRPQALLLDRDGQPTKLLYSTDGSGGVSIATALAETSDGGTTWSDHPANPVLDRIESDWQGRRAFCTAVVRDDENERWVMATVGDDTSPSTPGLRATGLWFSRDLVDWTQFSGNPVITVETDGAVENDVVFPGPADPPVGMYLRHFHKIGGVWHALVQWRGDGTWSRMTVMRSEGDITGPWRIRNLCLSPHDAGDWFKCNRNLNWCQPVRIQGRWYAACQNGVARSDEDNDRIGIVYSDDYFHWQEYDNPVTRHLARPGGSPVVSSQQFLLPPRDSGPWRILLGARGVHGDKFMYFVEP